ncbi:MAG: Holliday junction resolvase Hjc [Candidatus Aenigmatarchaeota archaeon]
MTISKYKKGYRAEWELLHKIYKSGFLAIRSPRSGRIGLPSPDIIAVKNRRLIVIECKSREDGFTVDKDQIGQLKAWKKRAKAMVYIAWRMSRKGWRFIPLEDVIKNRGRIGKKFYEKNGIEFDKIFK